MVFLRILFFCFVLPVELLGQESAPCDTLATIETAPCDTLFTKESAKYFIEKVQQQASDNIGTRETQQYQLRALSLSIVVGIIGFALSKEGSSHKWQLFGMAIAFCLFMHGLDTMLWDLNERQIDYGNSLDCYILQWDSIGQDGWHKALNHVYTWGKTNNTFHNQPGWYRKTALYFWGHGPSFPSIWWWGLVGAIGFVWWRVKKHDDIQEWKHHPRGF